MEVKNIKNYEHYQLFEDGRVLNTETNKYIKNRFNKNNGLHYVYLTKNKIRKNFVLARLVYENYYDVQLTNKEIIKFNDGNNENHHYKNLIKI